MSTSLNNNTNADNELHEPRAPKLPEEGKRNILITSALPYVNNVPHLGNIIGCVLSADTYARYCRARGYNAIYICGTDEYGTATEAKAREEHLTPRQLCDKYFAIHRDVYKWFDISFDFFGRTSMPKQTEIAQDIFCKLHDRGFCEKKSVQQLFCEQCQTFLADRFVEGICPHCGFEDARGDQCDQCGRLLDPLELKEPRCKFDRTTPTIKTSNHVFLDLPKVQDQLEAWIDKSSVEGNWTLNSVNLTKGWIASGLKSRCITRDLRWGTPVPLDGFRDKVFYVWFDAPIGYISITANYTDQWEKWWKNPENVRLVQFMGKDNVPFHTVIFPSTLIATGEKWTLLHHLSTTEYLNYEGGKFSKSRGTGVFGDSAQSTGIPADIWRFYLLSNRPESADYTFSWDDFMFKNNSELLDNFGNMCNRVLSFIRANFASQIPDLKLPLTQHDLEFLKIVDEGYRNYIQALEKVAIRDGVRIAMDISRAANKFLQETGPWVLIKTDRDRCGTVLRIVSDVILLLAHLFSPYTPGLSRQIFRQLNLPDDDQLVSLREPPAQNQSSQFRYPFPDYTGHVLSSGHTIGTVAPLIRKLQEDEIKALKQKFLGNAFQNELQRVDTITFTKDPSITWPCVILAFKDITVKRKTAGSEKWIKAVTPTLNVDEISRKPHVSQYEQAKQLQIDRDEAPTSVQNLINMIREKKRLPNINTLVDIYNIVSLREGVVMGAYDLKALNGNLHFAVAKGTESYIQVNQTQKQPIFAGEWIIKDDGGHVVTRITTKQSAESATSLNTKNCIMCIQGNPSTSQEFLLTVASDLGKQLVEHVGGSFRVVYPELK